MKSVTSENKGAAAQVRTRGRIFNFLRQEGRRLTTAEIASALKMSVSTVLRYKPDIEWFYEAQLPKITVTPVTPVTGKDKIVTAIGRIDFAIQQTQGGRIGGTPLWQALHDAKRDLTEALAKI